MECVALEIVGDMRPAPAPPEAPLLHPPPRFIIIYHYHQAISHCKPLPDIIIIIMKLPSTSKTYHHYDYHQLRVLPHPHIITINAN